jgi:uncharacterized membrane protein/protein-disulfide isomerase
MTKRAGVFALVCAVVGLTASVAASYTHYHLLFDPAYRSFCDVNERISCTTVYMSRYSTFQGIPVAIFGALWFVVAGLLGIVGLRAKGAVGESAPGYLFVMSTVGLSVILYLGYTSFFVLNAVCLLCLTTYAAVIGLFLVSGAATSFPMTTLPTRAARDARVFVKSPVAIVIALLFFAGAGTTLAWFPRESVTASGEVVPPPVSQDRQSEFLRFYQGQPRIPLVIPSDGAKVLIVKFNDFQCPACGQSYLQYKPIFAKYEADHPGDVKVVLKDYPLNVDCNNAISQTLHPSACDAAVAVRLSQAHGKMDAMEDYLYTHQPQMTPPMVRQAARDVGGVTDFDAKYASTIALVKGDIALGKQLGVRSTPTFFINGVKLEGGFPPQYIDQAIAYELSRAGSK